MTKLNSKNALFVRIGTQLCQFSPYSKSKISIKKWKM